MVECRTILLTVGGVECIGKLYPAPANVILRFPDSSAVLSRYHIKYNLMPVIWRQVKRHHIINLRLSQTDIYCLGNLSIDKHIYTCVLIALLNREEKIAGSSVCPHQGIVDPEMIHLHSFCRRGEKSRCHHYR